MISFTSHDAFCEYIGEQLSRKDHGDNEADLLAVQLLKMIKKYIEEFPGIDEQKEESDEHSD